MRLLLWGSILTFWPLTAAVAQTYVEPPFAGTVTTQQAIEESTYFTFPDTPPVPGALEFMMDDGTGNVVKTGPYWPQAFLQNPEGIPLELTFIKTCDMREIDESLDEDGCIGFDLDNDHVVDFVNCIERNIYLVNGFLAAVTVETNNPRQLDPNLLFYGDPEAPINPPPEPPLVVITTPATDDDEYEPRIGPDEDPCFHHVLSAWIDHTAIWNTVNLHGAAITIIDPWTAGNRILHDVLSYYVAARLARALFAVQGEGPILYAYSGSWGGAMSLAAATLHPHIYGAFSLAGIFEVDEYVNHVDNFAKRRMTLGLGKVVDWDGPHTRRHLGYHVVARNLVPLGVDSMAQWMSAMHQTERLDDVLYWGYGGGDFSTDPYGPNLSQLQAKLEALDKDHMFLPDVRDFAGHGFPLNPPELYPFLKALYWHWLDLEAAGGPTVAPPFSSDGYVPGENRLYLDILHQVPASASSGSDLALISALVASQEGGVAFPGRLDAIAFLSHEGSDYFVMSAGHGRLRLYQIGPSGTVTLIHTTESQGWGAAGLLVDGDRILSTSAKGNFRAWEISGAGPSAFLIPVYAHDTKDGRRFGDFPRMVKTTLRFFTGDAIFTYGYPPYMGQEPFGNVTIVDASDYDNLMQFDCDPISFAMPYVDDQGRETIFMATPRGYGGTLDPNEPWVIHNGTAKLKFDKISEFVNMQVLGGVQRWLNGSRHLVLAGAAGVHQMVVLDDQLKIESIWIDPEPHDPQGLVPSAVDDTFYARHGLKVSRYELQDVGGDPTVVRLKLGVFSAPGVIEGFGARSWTNGTLFVAGARDSFQVVSVAPDDSLTVLHDTYGSNESHYQALDCSDGSCFVLNRDDGKIYAVGEDMKRGLLLAEKELSDGTTPFNFLLVDEKVTPPHDYYPTIYKSSRLMNLDTGTYGDEIAYNNAGTIEVYDLQPGGCLIDDGDASGCEPTFASAEQIIIGGGAMDHNVKFYATQGEKTIVVTGGTGFIGVFKNGPIAGTYQLKLHENLLGRFCHALDARVVNGEDVIYTGCDTEGESGGALNRWRLDCSGEPCELVKEWSAYPGSAPTAIRWIPGEASGCPGERLVFADFAGSLYVLDGDSAAGPGGLLVKSASLEGGGPGAVSGLHHLRTINGDLVDDLLRFSTPAQRYAVTLTTDCSE